MYPNEYKLIGTVRGTTLLQPAFGEVLIEGDVIEAETHNAIQKNGVLASKVTIALDGTDTVITPNNVVIDGNLEDELKLLLLFETATTLPSTTFIKVKDTNIPVVNVNDYVVNANTPLLFLYFDSKFYAYKAGEGASTGAESLGDLSDVTLTSPVSGQTLVYNGTNFVNQTVESATETTSGTIKIATQLQVAIGTDNTTAITPYKLKEWANGTSRKLMQNGYIRHSDGIIEQWGTGVTRAGDGINGTLLNFPIAFPNACITIVSTDYGHSCNVLAIAPFSQTQYKVWGKSMSTNGYSDTIFTFRAIGY